jgi:hypothetical protein
MLMKIKGRSPFVISLVWLLLFAILESRPVQASEKNCASQIADRQQEEENRIDIQKALSLANAAGEFGRRFKGYKAEFNSIYFIHSFDPVTCDYRGIDSVNVVYGLSDNDKPVKNVVAHLDGNLKGLKEVSEHAADKVFIIDHTSKGWSGYVAAALKNSGTSYEILSAVNVKWTVPKIDTPDTGDLFCTTISCDISAWAGLYGVYDETTSSGTQAPLAQTGSTSSRKCGWEASTSWDSLANIEFNCRNSHYLWYEFLPAAGVKCTNAGTVSSGDSISAEVKKRRSANSYVMTVSNLTTGKSCSVSQDYSLPTPVFGSFIVEPPVAVSTGSSTTLPTFSTITMANAGVSWYRSEGLVQYDLYYMANVLSKTKTAGVIREILYQGSARNISAGNLTSGGSFTQTYLTSAK